MWLYVSLQSDITHRLAIAYIDSEYAAAAESEAVCAALETVLFLHVPVGHRLPFSDRLL